MSRPIFPSSNDVEAIRRKKLHEQFNNEIKQLQTSIVHLVVFELDELKFAIEIEKIDEVVLTPSINKLPKTPDYVPGLAAVRGVDIVIVDLALKLGLSKARVSTEEIYPYTIIVASRRFTVGILTKNIPTSIKFSGEQIQPTGLDIAGNPEDETYIKGVIKAKNDQIYFIDIDELLEGERNEQNDLKTNL